MKLSKHQISVLEHFLAEDIDHLRKGLIKMLLVLLQSDEEVQLIFDTEFFVLFGQLLELLELPK
jgi:hypothetical protein